VAIPPGSESVVPVYEKWIADIGLPAAYMGEPADSTPSARNDVLIRNQEKFLLPIIKPVGHDKACSGTQRPATDVIRLERHCIEHQLMADCLQTHLIKKMAG
jgi:hypothetical protein